MRMTFRVLVYALCLLLCYGLALTLLSNWVYRGQTLLSRLTHNSLQPGGLGYSLVRYREIQHYQDIDILFIGSSHCYRSFDPRIFQTHGLRVFNAGSRNQSPINTYFLMKRFLVELNPRLVVMDASFETFQSREGLEAFYDLSWNMPYAKELLQMALASHHPYAINTALSLMLEALRPNYAKIFATRVQKPQQGKRYIPGGYVETHRVTAPVIKDQSHVVRLSERQLTYFAALIKMMRKHRIPMRIVIQPLPREVLGSIANYRAATDRIAGIARRHGVPFTDFNDTLVLDSQSDFMDNEHLNHKGVTLYNRHFIEQMKPDLDTLLDHRQSAAGDRYATPSILPLQN